MTPKLTNEDWTRVSKALPCPVCGKSDWCMIGKLHVLCNRKWSAKPAKDGGYYHSLDGKSQPVIPRASRKPEPPSINCTKLLAGWAAQMPLGATKHYAGILGVSEPSLVTLGAVYAPSYRAWAFPMRDGYGNPVGIRLRADDGRKWAVIGSKQGLFLPGAPPELTIYVCEGPTDTAAALTIGVYAVGRPSCSGGALELRAFCKKWAVRQAVIVSDHDADKLRPDGSKWNPGQEGAAKLARELRLPFKIWTPAAKDVRQWLHLGGTRSLLEEHLANLRWLKP